MITTLILPLIFACSPFQAKPTFEDVLKQYDMQIRHGRMSEPDQMALAEKTAEQIEIKELDRTQLYTLCMYGFSRSDKVRPRIVARLDGLPVADRDEKARVAYTKILAEYSTPEGPTVLREALKEPGTVDLLNSKDSAMVFYTLFCGLRTDKANLALNLDSVMSWFKKTDHLDAWDHGVMSMIYDWAKTDLPKNKALQAKIRSVCGALDRRTLDKGKLSDADRPRVEMDFEAFTGPALNGTLIGHQSPEITFRWCSDSNVKKLSDYFPGKVVVLDFWTTWCGPCVAAFPHIRELVDHYEGKPVVFVGITSIQGRDYDPDGTIDCTGNPDKETGLMPSFMKKRQMTWTVAFSTKDAFDPAFGVHDIPHMAIIDSKGIVRYNELRPSMTNQEFESLIDPLLK